VTTRAAFRRRHARIAACGIDERFAGAALLEMFDGNDRLAVDYGASGAPVYDCDGRIAMRPLATETERGSHEH